MLQTGDPIVLRINEEPYLEKPPLLFWSIAAISMPFGDVNEWTARIPSVLGALLTLVCTYLLGASMFGRRVAFWSVLIMMTTIRFWYQARYAQIDMLLTGCMSVSLLALWQWELERRAKWLILLYAAIGAGLLAKGPPALIFPLLLIFFFYRGNKPARRQTHWLLGTLAALALVLAWYLPARMLGADTTDAAVQSGIGENLFRNTIGRAFLGVSKAQWPWYYLENLPVDLLPWAIFLPWTIYWTWTHRRENRAMRFLLCYTVPAFIFFSIVIGKRAIYILPLWPAFGLLLGASILDLMDSPRETWRKRTGYVWAALLFLLALLPIAATFTEYAHIVDSRLAGFAFFAFLAGGYTFGRMQKTNAAGLHAIMAGQFAVILFIAAFAILPVVDGFKSARDFCAPVRLLAEANAEFDLYSVGFSREEYVFYSKHPHEEVFTDLLDLDLGEELSLLELAKLQKDAHEAIRDAVEEVPVENIEHITEAERAALREAILAAATSVDEEGRDLHAFEAALEAEVAAFAQEFNDSEPAFIFVKDEDWRWLLPMQENPPPYHVLRHDTVGRRFVLLLANEAGMQLLEEHRID
jgi:4-amino-4-deoxy-L-arabinose transferase-like glycosyltransferase